MVCPAALLKLVLVVLFALVGKRLRSAVSSSQRCRAFGRQCSSLPPQLPTPPCAATHTSPPLLNHCRCLVCGSPFPKATASKASPSTNSPKAQTSSTPPSSTSSQTPKAT